MPYVKAFQDQSFHEPTIRKRKGRLEITATLVGIPQNKFKQVRAPYTRQFLRHMPSLAPQELRPHDHKQAPPNASGSTETVPPATRSRTSQE